MQFQQLAAHPRPRLEIPVKGQTGELPQQVNGVLLAVHRVVEGGVGIGEDVLGGDAAVAVMLAELPQPPLGDVADLFSFFRVTEERETVSVSGKVIIRETVCGQNIKRLAIRTDADHFVIWVSLVRKYAGLLIPPMSYYRGIVAEFSCIWTI